MHCGYELTKDFSQFSWILHFLPLSEDSHFLDNGVSLVSQWPALTTVSSAMTMPQKQTIFLLALFNGHFVWSLLTSTHLVTSPLFLLLPRDLDYLSVSYKGIFIPGLCLCSFLCQELSSTWYSHSLLSHALQESAKTLFCQWMFPDQAGENSNHHLPNHPYIT